MERYPGWIDKYFFPGPPLPEGYKPVALNPGVDNILDISDTTQITSIIIDAKGGLTDFIIKEPEGYRQILFRHVIKGKYEYKIVYKKGNSVSTRNINGERQRDEGDEYIEYKGTFVLE
jgi:hypothetical protein